MGTLMPFTIDTNEPLVEAAKLSHERLYKVASGQLPPYDETVQYLPKLFL